MSNIWFSSDMHFGHTNVIKYSERPFEDVQEMDHYIINQYNRFVKPGDTCYFLGDVFFGNEGRARQIMQYLCPGSYRILIRGNHDKFSLGQYTKLGFDLVLPHSAHIQIAGQHVILSHYPYKFTPEEVKHAKENDYKLKYQDRRIEDIGGWLVHGHAHDLWKTKRKMINIGVDQWGFEPVNIKQIAKIIKESK